MTLLRGLPLVALLVASCAPGPEVRFHCDEDGSCADGLVCFQDHCYPPAERCTALCEALAWSCGAIPGDSCDCGTCPAGETCGAAGVNRCGPGSCTPATCAEELANCGPITDTCGGVAECGECEAPSTCGGDGRENVCSGTCVGAAPSELCAAAGRSCGPLTVTDACGRERELDCGGCTLPDTCGGAGVCGCSESPAEVCPPAGYECGVWQLQGQCPQPSAVDCGGCPSPLTCGGDGEEGRCGCVAETDEALCATAPAGCSPTTFVDRCGAERVLECTPCTVPGESCGGGGTAGVCGCTLPSAEDYCGANELECGPVTVSLCGAPRTFDCGACVEGTCGAAQDNHCCVAESEQQVCLRLGKTCGMVSTTDVCGTPVTVDCGTCPGGGTCMPDNVCACAPNQESCDTGAACCSGACDGHCCVPTGGTCSDPSDCCGRSDCSGSSCCLISGEPAPADAQCCSGEREGGSCCSPPTQTCRTADDCCGNQLCNVDKLCCRPPAEPCGKSSECCSGVCNGDVCA